MARFSQICSSPVAIGEVVEDIRKGYRKLKPSVGL